MFVSHHRLALLSSVILPLCIALLVTVSACTSDESTGGATSTSGGTEAGTSDTKAGNGTEGETSPGADAGGKADGAVPGSLELTVADDGGSFAVKSGGTITLALPASPSTGFVWEMDDPDPEASLLEQLVDPSFQADDPGAVGSGGIMTFTFRAVDDGSMVLRLVHLPPDGSKATDTFEVDLHVE